MEGYEWRDREYIMESEDDGNEILKVRLLFGVCNYKPKYLKYTCLKLFT